jgi:hypothetical protein
VLQLSRVTLEECFHPIGNSWAWNCLVLLIEVRIHGIPTTAEFWLDIGFKDLASMGEALLQDESHTCVILI